MVENSLIYHVLPHYFCPVFEGNCINTDKRRCHTDGSQEDETVVIKVILVKSFYEVNKNSSSVSPTI